MTIHSAARAAALMSCTAALLAVAPPARANLVITPVYSDAITPEARAVIADALKLYADNFTGNTTVIVGFGIQAGGGASATQFNDVVTYANYLKALKGNATESATDVSALASLPGNAPVGNGNVKVAEALAVQLGLGTATAGTSLKGPSDACSGLVINSCVSYSSAYIKDLTTGGPASGLYGVTQHEIDEILGTSSALTANVAPAPSDRETSTAITANSADLFRYSAPGSRSFSTNPSNGAAGCPSGTPLAYLSIDAGTNNLAAYNNCGNGGDYGDFALGSTKQPQDYTSASTSASSLSLTSPEIQLLDAVGWNIGSNPTVAVGTPTRFTNAVLSTTASTEGGEDDGILAETVPEPASLVLLGFGVAVGSMTKRRRAV